MADGHEVESAPDGPVAPPRGMRHLRLFAVGYTVSSFGNNLNMVALSVFAYHATGSALQTGVFMALRLTASFVSGLTAGGVIARYPRKRVMITSDLLQASALVVLVLAPTGTRVSLLYVLALLFGFCGTMSGVALRSGVPDIVGVEHRVQANALLVTGRSIAMIAGFAGAGVIVATAGYDAVFLLDAATFVVSAANLGWLPILNRPPARAPATPDAGTSRRSAHRAALGYLTAAAPVLLVMIAIRTVDTFGSAAHNVALPVYSTGLDPGDPAGFVGRFLAVWAVGNLLVQQLVSRLVRRTGREVGEKAFAVGTCLMSAMFILAFTGIGWPAVIAVALAAGVADGFTEIAYHSRLQTAPEHQRGHVFGLSATVESVGFGSGMVLSAALLERYAPVTVVGVFHGVAIVLALAFLLYLARSRRLRGPGTSDITDPRPAAPAETAEVSPHASA